MKTLAAPSPAKPTAPRRSLLPAARSRVLQRKCACGGTPGPSGECEECRQKRLQRQASPSPATSPGIAPPIVHEVLRGTGQPLDPATRAFMEPRFGHDFRHVRVHTDAKAAASARAVNALAYTVGRDIVFDRGHYQPGTAHGSMLLAHELVHTLQQHPAGSAESRQPAELRIGEPDHHSENEAETLAGQALAPVPDGRVAARMAGPALFRTERVLARYDCSKLTYKTCTTGVYSCGYGGSGTCGWVGPSRGGCICTGADKPPIAKVLSVLAIIGLSVALIATVMAALADPEPATKLGLAGLSAAEVAMLLTLLGYKKTDDSGPSAAADDNKSTNAGVA